jgi:hypothetical protein
VIWLPNPSLEHIVNAQLTQAPETFGKVVSRARGQGSSPWRVNAG